MAMQEWFDTNRAHWDELARLHPKTRFYDVPGFLAGATALKSIEREELPIRPGQTLLHLQCHFGLDTLSWARLGARVTGVDFSPVAIEKARSLAEQAGLPAEFICSNLYDFNIAPERRFDIVFTSYGALVWLPDLARWADVVARHLAPGGTFYIVEVHPLSLVFDDRPGATEPRAHYPYFEGAPIPWEGEGSYADKSAHVENNKCITFNHSFGEILSVLISAGLVIELVHEFPFSVCQTLPYLVEGSDGWWHPPEGMPSLPLLFSLRARKPRAGETGERSIDV